MKLFKNNRQPPTINRGGRRGRARHHDIALLLATTTCIERVHVLVQTAVAIVGRQSDRHGRVYILGLFFFASFQACRFRIQISFCNTQ